LDGLYNEKWGKMEEDMWQDLCGKAIIFSAKFRLKGVLPHENDYLKNV